MTTKFLKNRPLKKAILKDIDNLPPMPQVMHKAQAIINDPNSDHPLKRIFTNEDLDRLAENPPSMEDVSKFMQYFFQDPNFNPFTQGGQIFNKY